MMSNVNTTYDAGVQPDSCPLNSTTVGHTGKSTPSKLRKPSRQQPQNLILSTTAPSNSISATTVIGKPLSDSLKARIRKGPVGKSLGRLAVEHDLVPHLSESALMGITGDDKHSRQSYISIANGAIDHARVHLKKGERPSYVDPETVRTQTAPPVLEGISQSTQQSYAGTYRNLSAPAELETTELRQEQDTSQHNIHEMSSDQSSPPARGPPAFRRGKRHPLCGKFELSADPIAKTEEFENIDELYLDNSSKLPELCKSEVSRCPPANFSKPLPKILELYLDEPKVSRQSMLRHPTVLRMGDRSLTNPGDSSAGPTGRSHPKSRLIHNSDRANLKNFTAPPTFFTAETDSIANIRMHLGRIPSAEENDQLSSQDQSKAKARRHRGTVIVACDSDVEDACDNQICAADILALKHLGEMEDDSTSNFSYGSGSESPVVATAEAATAGHARLTEIKYQPFRPSKSTLSEPPVGYQPYSTSITSAQGKQQSASSAWFAAGQTIFPNETFPRVQPQSHPHPLRCNPLDLATPARSELRPVPSILRHGGIRQRKVVEQQDDILTALAPVLGSDKPTRSLKSLRRLTRDPANHGIAFGVHQFLDHDPAVEYCGSDQYRRMRAARRKEAKQVSDVTAADAVTVTV